MPFWIWGQVLSPLLTVEHTYAYQLEIYNLAISQHRDIFTKMLWRWTWYLQHPTDSTPLPLLTHTFISLYQWWHLVLHVALISYLWAFSLCSYWSSFLRFKLEKKLRSKLYNWTRSLMSIKELQADTSKPGRSKQTIPLKGIGLDDQHILHSQQMSLKS